MKLNIRILTVLDRAGFVQPRGSLVLTIIYLIFPVSPAGKLNFLLQASICLIMLPATQSIS